jgi:hypothetical protein
VQDAGVQLRAEALLDDAVAAAGMAVEAGAPCALPIAAASSSAEISTPGASARSSVPSRRTIA